MPVADWPQRLQQPTRRTAFIADTTALILFFTTTGIINERFIAGMTWDQVLHARLLGAAVMMLVLGRPYGAFLNGVRKLFGLPPGGDKPMSLKG
ncbi:L-alanine exporter AlaE [Pseudomonas sp. AIG]